MPSQHKHMKIHSCTTPFGECAGNFTDENPRSVFAHRADGLVDDVLRPPHVVVSVLVREVDFSGHEGVDLRADVAVRDPQPGPDGAGAVDARHHLEVPHLRRKG